MKYPFSYCKISSDIFFISCSDPKIRCKQMLDSVIDLCKCCSIGFKNLNNLVAKQNSIEHVQFLTMSRNNNSAMSRPWGGTP